MSLFKRLFVLGRPASGKSEFLDFMRKLPDKERAEKFHVGKMAELDDFVWIWEKGEEDALWEKVIGKRLHTRRVDCGFMFDFELYDFLIEKLNFEACRKYLGNEEFYTNNTLLIEFSRGGEKPYSDALKRFDPKIFESSAILYIEVSGEESARRNEARYRKKLESSILAHKVPDEEMNRIYKNDDWHKITEGKRNGRIRLNGVDVPFVTMNNEPESTDPKILVPRYQAALTTLWENY